MQLGTLSGNPVAAAAGLKTLEILRRAPGQYDRLLAGVCVDSRRQRVRRTVDVAPQSPSSSAIQSFERTGANDSIMPRSPNSCRLTVRFGPRGQITEDPCSLSGS
jgi:hypothetical protein